MPMESRLTIFRGPLASKVCRVDRILLVAQVVIGHDERKQDRYDRETRRSYAQNLHRVVIRCSYNLRLKAYSTPRDGRTNLR
jgi:hypothetical protein